MTSKRKQIIKKPISIFFSKKQIPKKHTNILFEEYSSYSIFNSKDKIFVDLTKISNLDILQKNFKLLLIGMAINSYCKSGKYFVDYFGCSKTDIRNFYLGWSLGGYTFEKYKSKKEKPSTAKISCKFEKDTCSTLKTKRQNGTKGN